MLNHDHIDREIQFHNELADTLRIEDESIFLTAPAAMEIQYILSMIGKLEGKRILDLGAGTGEGALNFSRMGGDASFCDITPKLVEFVTRLGKGKLTGKVCPAEALDFPDEYFDFIYMHGVLHHVTDRDQAYREIWRCLKPGGRFFAIEPLVGNPAIWIYRHMAGGMRSPDEAPLTLGELAKMRAVFRDCSARTFWLLTQSLFMKYYLVDRVHPSQERYWRRIYHETDGSLWWWKPLRALDSLLTRIPLIRRWAYTAVFTGMR